MLLCHFNRALLLRNQHLTSPAAEALHVAYLHAAVLILSDPTLIRRRGTSTARSTRTARGLVLVALTSETCIENEQELFYNIPMLRMSMGSSHAQQAGLIRLSAPAPSKAGGWAALAHPSLLPPFLRKSTIFGKPAAAASCCEVRGGKREEACTYKRNARTSTGMRNAGPCSIPAIEYASCARNAAAGQRRSILLVVPISAA